LIALVTVMLYMRRRVNCEAPEPPLTSSKATCARVIGAQVEALMRTLSRGLDQVRQHAGQQTSMRDAELSIATGTRPRALHAFTLAIPSALSSVASENRSLLTASHSDQSRHGTTRGEPPKVASFRALVS
jgi:hypothetical protein